MNFKFVQFSHQDHVAHLVLNRPDVRNAFNQEMISEIEEIFQIQLPLLSDLRAVVLTGAGLSFSSGGDLEWMKSMVTYTMEQNLADARSLFSMFNSMKNCPVPLVGYVHGHAMGGGVGLTAVCDIVACENATEFALSEVRLGIAPAVIAPFVLEKMSPSSARRYMLTGDKFSAAEALAFGLVNFTGTKAECDTFIESTLKSFFDSGPEAVRAAKQHLKFCLFEKDVTKLEAECTRVIASRRVSAEGQDGLKAFLNKTKPNFKIARVRK
jgi:methylglutaconyl-CoA hydratase